MTWKEKILFVMNNKAKSGRFMWYSHAKIKLGLIDNFGLKRRTVSVYLTSLVRTGHVERALVPSHMKQGDDVAVSYLYRLTGKPFKAYKGIKGVRGSGNRVIVNHALWHEYKHCSKALRRLML